eukprot:scaffold41684_cov160-Amphora_coffeaeformis.AAC.5
MGTWDNLGPRWNRSIRQEVQGNHRRGFAPSQCDNFRSNDTGIRLVRVTSSKGSFETSSVWGSYLRIKPGGGVSVPSA